MFSNDIVFYTVDILISISKMNNSVRRRGDSLDDIYIDYELQSIFERQFEIIGEAVKKIGEINNKASKDNKTIENNILLQYPDIPWNNIARMRDKVIHHYNAVDYDVLGQTFVAYLEELRETCEKYLINLGLPIENVKEINYDSNKITLKSKLINKIIK